MLLSEASELIDDGFRAGRIGKDEKELGVKLFCAINSGAYKGEQLDA